MSTTISALGYFPFCIQENAQDGLPVEFWDGVTYYKLEGQWPDGDDDPFEGTVDFYPSKTSNVPIDVLGDGTFYPVGFTFEELMFLYWRVRRFDVKPVDGPEWIAGPLDVFPIIEGGTELEIANYFGAPRPLQNAEARLVCGPQTFRQLDRVFYQYYPYGAAIHIDDYLEEGDEIGQIFFSLDLLFFPIGRTYPQGGSLGPESGPVYRSGDLYYPRIYVQGSYRNFEQLAPPGYETRNFQKNILPFKYKEEDWDVNIGWIDVSGPPKADSFRLILKLPTRDVTIPFYALIGYEYPNFPDPLITLVIEPSKYLTYGGTYDEDTGQPV